MNEEQRKRIRQRFDELDLMPNPDNFTNYKGLFLNEKWIDCNGNAMEDIKDFIIAEVERAELKYKTTLEILKVDLAMNADYNEQFNRIALENNRIIEQALKNLGGEK